MANLTGGAAFSAFDGAINMVHCLLDTACAQSATGEGETMQKGLPL